MGLSKDTDLGVKSLKSGPFLTLPTCVILGSLLNGFGIIVFSTIQSK